MLIDPVVGEKFFGREDVLAILEKRVCALKYGYRQNIAITGHRLTGKSSILNHFLFALKDNEILPIYLEVLPEPFKQFAVKFIGTLLYNFLKYNQREVQDNLEYLIKKCEVEIPKTIACVKNILEHIQDGQNENAYSELLNLTSVLKEESKKPCVIILDEFHNLSKLGIREPFKGFGKKIMTQKDTMYIVASSEVASIKRILSEKLALLFGNFEKITLGGFDCETSRLFLHRELSTVKISDELLDFIISFGDGHPFYLDVLSGKINELMGNLHFRMVTASTLIQAIEELLFDARGTLNQFFINLLQDLIDSEEESCKETLIAIARGLYRQREISKWTGYSNKETSRHFKILVEKNLIYKSGNIYRFYDKVLRFWLNKVYHKRRRTLIDNISEKAKNFKYEIESLIDQFFVESALNTNLRIKNLFDSFGNEIVEINAKRQQLMHFDKTQIVGNNGKIYIVGYFKHKLCLAYLSKKILDENDILDFIAYGIRYKPKLQRRIIISLEDMDINAKLMAKEMKMWIWDIDAINELLDIFGKQKIVSIHQ
jgi:hypothetical protein